MSVGTMLCLCGCDPCNATFEEVEPAERYETAGGAEPAGAVESPTVMTWNIKFGGDRIRFFFECPGDRVLMERDEVVDNLGAVAEKIRQVDPDILLLQEVDVESKRVAGVDQVQWLLDRTPLEYAVYASQWRATYVPKHGLGHVDSGNVVMAKWPFDRAVRLALPLIRDQDPVTRYFYLKRNMLKATLDVPGYGDLTVVNTHLSAFSEDGTRRRQVRELEEELASIDDSGRRIVAGGDLNLIPPGSERTTDFPDVSCSKEDFEPADYGDKLGVLQGLYDRYRAAIPLEKYRTSNDPYFTYSADADVGWSRKLDYLFTNADWRDGLVHQGEDRGGLPTLERSDHAPVTGELGGKSR